MADKKKILIADDFQLLREDLTELINNQRDMEVVGTASSGKEIVNLARNTEYDLILMDIEMETMNAGILATQEIREADPEAGIIFLTAHETREMIVTAMGAGALDYIVKDVRMKKYFTISAVLSKGIQLCQIRSMRL